MTKNSIHNEVDHINMRIQDLKCYGGSAKQISDGYHTFDELYYHRMILTSIIANQNKSNAWKSKLHHDGTMFDGSFIIGFNTIEGQYSYHYKLEYWDLFNVKELDKAPKYDGHKPGDIGRLVSLV